MVGKGKPSGKVDFFDDLTRDGSSQTLSTQPKPLKMGPNDNQMVEMSVSNSNQLNQYVNPFDIGGASSSLSITAQHIQDRQKDQTNIESQNQSKPVEMKVTDADKTDLENYVPKPRKYKLGGLSAAQLQKITKYKENYGKYLQLHNNSKQKEVWKIYDYIADQLMSECVNEALGQVVTQDIEGYLLEQIMIDEF